MIDLYLINKIFIILIDTLGVWFGIWVYINNPKAKTNQLFALMIILALVWITLCYFSGILTNNLLVSLFLGRLAYGVAILFFIPFYFFSSFFVGRYKKTRLLDSFILTGSILIFIFSVFTNFMAKNMVPVRTGVAPTIGDGKYIYFGFVFFVSLFVTARLSLNYFKSSKSEKLKLQYFFLGILIFVIANIIFNIILTFREGVVRYYQVGNYSAIFLLGFTAYAIVKRELFGIKVVVTTIFVGLISILLGLDALVFTDQLLLQLFKGLILLIFLYFGYLLIKSVMREIKQKEEIERLSNAKSEFISIASHQLRTPLTAIKGYISMALEGSFGKIPEKAQRPIKNVYDSNERLIRLVNELLTFSRLESGKIEITKESADIVDLISKVVNIFKVETNRKGLSLKWEKPATALPQVMLDSSKITEAISNLINNAIKYTPKGGIAIRLKTINSKLQIEIKDTGVGMTKEEMAKLFQSFSRGATGSRLYTEGAGLGLYIAKKYIEMNDGTLTVFSSGPGKGTTFTIELPVG